MRRRGPEQVAHLGRPGVGVRARINQERAPAARQLQCERIGVRVSAVEGAVRAAIDQQVIGGARPSIAHHVVTAIGKGARALCGRTGLDAVERLQARGAEQPERLHGGFAGHIFVVRAPEEDGARRERPAKVVRGTLIEDHQPSAIVVADEGSRPVRTGDVHQVIEQRPQLPGKLRSYVLSARLSKDEKVHVDIGGVTMVVAGLLEVDAVGPHVPGKRCQQDAPAGFAPASRSPELRQQGAEIEEAQSLPRQMRIGAVVRGQVRLQMPRVAVK